MDTFSSTTKFQSTSVRLRKSISGSVAAAGWALVLFLSSHAFGQTSDFEPATIKIGEIPGWAVQEQGKDPFAEPKQSTGNQQSAIDTQSSDNTQAAIESNGASASIDQPKSTETPNQGLPAESSNQLLPLSTNQTGPAFGILPLSDASPNRPYYQLDPSHTSLVFAIGHGNFSFVYGRFSRCDGQFVLDENQPNNSQFNFTIEAASVDTNDQERDKHLRGPDFFDVQQHAEITFQSTEIEFKDGVYTAKGSMTMLGKAQEIEIPFQLLGRGKGIFGKERAGFFTKFRLKRSDFGMTKMLSAGVGNNISVTFSFEGILKSELENNQTRMATEPSPKGPSNK